MFAGGPGEPTVYSNWVMLGWGRSKMLAGACPNFGPLAYEEAILSDGPPPVDLV